MCPFVSFLALGHVGGRLCSKSRISFGLRGRNEMGEIKISIFSTREEVQRIAACTHEWRNLPPDTWINPGGPVEAKCLRCGTYRRTPESMLKKNLED